MPRRREHDDPAVPEEVVLAGELAPAQRVVEVRPDVDAALVDGRPVRERELAGLDVDRGVPEPLEAAGVVEVQVGLDHVLHVGRPELEHRELAHHVVVRREPLDDERVRRRAHVGVRIAAERRMQAGVDQHVPPRMRDEVEEVRAQDLLADPRVEGVEDRPVGAFRPAVERVQPHLLAHVPLLATPVDVCRTAKDRERRRRALTPAARAPYAHRLHIAPLGVQWTEDLRVPAHHILLDRDPTGGEMAVASVEHTLPKTLSWKDGFMIALSVPAGVLASLGVSIGSLGAWGAATLWCTCCVIGILQNFLFAEMAAMFPEKPGGIALYAHEAWRKYFSPIGPICAFGYWMGWSFVLSIFGLVIGQLVQAQWFPGQTWTFSDGFVHVGLPHLIGAGAVALVWALNVFGLRPAMRVNWGVGVALMAALAVFIIGPFATGNFDSSKLHWNLGESGQAWGGLKLALVWLFLMGWSGYATEICATFAPEYKERAATPASPCARRAS